MTLNLRVVGPGLDVQRELEAGAPALVLGRDAECGVCLPDPRRNVSRRHLSVWNEGGELHFHVLSTVNGIEMPSGEAPPGARGVLPPGQTLKVAEYSVTVTGADDDAGDPWAALDREGSGIAPAVDDSTLHTRPATRERIEADPFGDWGFETTFGPGGLAGEPLEAKALGVAQDLSAFFTGLGLDAKEIGALSEGELETLGRVVRLLATGLLQMQAATLQTKQGLNAEDRTLVAGPRGGMNPLASDATESDKLRYLFGGRAASAGFLGPERAVADLVDGLLAHESATGNAVREATAAVLRDFDPETLKNQLLAGGARLFESARAWDAYAKFYAERRARLPQWAQELLDRHFAEAYLRETQRAKRHTSPQGE